MASVIEDAKYLTTVSDKGQHAHNCYEMIFLKKGLLKLTVSEQQYTVQAPALIFLSKLEQHSLHILGSEYERYYLCISPMVAGNVLQEYTLLSLLANRPENFCHVLDASGFASAIEGLFASCVQEAEEKLPFASLRQAALLQEILILIFRHAPWLFTQENSKSISVIWKIQCELEQNCREHFSLTELSERYHMSTCYLSHLFKKVTGYSVIQYLTMCRLSLARQYLTETDWPVTEIVYHTGFSDSSNFSRLFRRESGCSPVEYRKMFQK